MKTDIVGKRFGRLVVNSFDEIRNRHYYLNCTCDCGNKSSVDSSKLKSGHTQSCGCLMNERRIESHYKHGQSGRTVEYIAWISMKARCNTPSRIDFHRYGGRGIKVCDEWNLSFKKFFADMGKRPSKSHSIERLDVNGNYEPSNCVWIVNSAQARNRRDSIFVEYNGERKNLMALCEEKNMSYMTVYQRIKLLGWDISRAIDFPVRKCKHD